MRYLTFGLGCIVGMLLLAGSYTVGLHAKRHNCVAPCTVSFPMPMAEDTFGYDYHDEKLDVFWSAPDEVED